MIQESMRGYTPRSPPHSYGSIDFCWSADFECVCTSSLAFDNRRQSDKRVDLFSTIDTEITVLKKKKNLSADVFGRNDLRQLLQKKCIVSQVHLFSAHTKGQRELRPKTGGPSWRSLRLRLRPRGRTLELFQHSSLEVDQSWNKELEVFVFSIRIQHLRGTQKGL